MLHLNKFLEIWELVHHKDGNKENDNIDNLEVLNHFEHAAHHNNIVGKKPKGWKPANTIKPEVVERIKQIAKDMVKINYSEISRKLFKEGIIVNSYTISKYLKDGESKED